jgi:Tol biopolymer transport system component
MRTDVPPRPDVAPAVVDQRPRPVLAPALVGVIAWLAGSLVAWRSLGWYPPPYAKWFFLLAWLPLLVIGLMIGQIVEAGPRASAAMLLTLTTFGAPLLGATYLPGVAQPTEHRIPGRPWLAITAHPDGDDDLYLMKGGAAQLEAFGETPWSEGFSTLSPDRRHIVYSSNRFGTFDLFVLDLDANGNPIGTRRLTRDAGDDEGGDWSPDGTKIVYDERTGTTTTVEVISANGGTPARLTDPGSATGPKWSPDGSSIAFAATQTDDPNNWDIWIMNADGTNARDVIDAGAIDWWPNWSPDGTRIAFTDGSQPEYDVYVGNVDGSDVRNLTLGATGQDLAYGWTPDGSKVLFISDRDGTRGRFIYTMNPDGSDVELVLRI